MTDRPGGCAFNLVRMRWLPIRRRSGKRERIAPWQLTERIDEDPVTAFAWPRPDFDGAAHEFMIGLLSTAAAPEDDGSWGGWWFDPPAPKVLERRFATVAHAFDLDGPGPRFMQDLDPLKGVKPNDVKDVSELLIDAPGENTLKNNADLFVKRRGAPALCRAAAAIALYTMHAYAPAGGRGHRTSLRGGGPMTTLIVAAHEKYGDTLWGRLWPNVESEKQIKGREARPFPSQKPESIFPWLAPTRTSDRENHGRSTSQAEVHPLHVYWGMPRRIRLLFEDSDGRACGLTGAEDTVAVAQFRTRNYGANYTEGFEHPLTPYDLQKAGKPKLPVHPKPGDVSYRLWPGLVVRVDGRRDRAQTIRHGLMERARLWKDTRFLAFGYDMARAKARRWVEAEWPLWILASERRQSLLEHKRRQSLLEQFIGQATAGADKVSFLLVRAIKAALRDRPDDAPGDYGFVAERFYRETEGEFLFRLSEAEQEIGKDAKDAGDAEDPATPVRERWAPIMRKAALRLFDEYAPADGLESRSMRRHVKAHFSLDLALRGSGKDGRALFGKLKIPSPEATRKHKEEKAA